MAPHVSVDTHNQTHFDMNGYQELTRRTERTDYADDQQLLADFGISELSDPDKFNRSIGLLVAALGLCSEAGEAADMVKKHFEQGHPLDKRKLVKELGDTQWYVAVLARLVGARLADVAAGNIWKLFLRFGDKFSKDRSINRAE
jgi:NTP pyrophosphatase (non-canonical NTP hydrolase)